MEVQQPKLNDIIAVTSRLTHGEVTLIKTTPRKTVEKVLKMIHELSLVKSKNIGNNTSIWQFCVIDSNAAIGNDCNICSHCFIESGAIIGNRVTIKNGVYVWDGIHIEDDVFVGPNVTFTNDKNPKSKNKNFTLEKTKVMKGASIGGNATILPGICIGENAVIGAGSVVTKNVLPNTVVKGNPAK